MANSADADQMVLQGAIWSGSTLFSLGPELAGQGLTQLRFLEIAAASHGLSCDSILLGYFIFFTHNQN